MPYLQLNGKQTVWIYIFLSPLVHSRLLVSIRIPMVFLFIMYLRYQHKRFCYLLSKLVNEHDQWRTACWWLSCCQQWPTVNCRLPQRPLEGTCEADINQQAWRADIPLSKDRRPFFLNGFQVLIYCHIIDIKGLLLEKWTGYKFSFKNVFVEFRK